MRFREVRRLFAFSKQDRQVFAYIEEYSRRIDSWLKKNSPDRECTKRYILAGFWLDYRAANHGGENFVVNHTSAEERLARETRIRELMAEPNRKMPINGLPQSNIARLLKKEFAREDKRREAYFKYYSKPINATGEYLDLVGFPYDEDPADYLFNFVVHGQRNEPLGVGR